MSTVASAAVAAVAFVALYAGHQLGDHVIQSNADAAAKGAPTGARMAAGVHPWAGWGACLRHVFTYSLTQLAALGLAWIVAPLTAAGVVAGLLVSASSHAVIDRRWIVRRLIEYKGCHHWREAPYLLDQSLHMGALLVAAVVAAAVSTMDGVAVAAVAAVGLVGCALLAERRRA
ncbi:DUF3307 domain-containing protein [Allorhizocola rhizosphaerae]|uniref:DUF3307 domain-containing protein n=1 Tax=Allorhizocola rhizosphaerae TaxID=1872709 RepID=UPI000E3B6513|nr:DUF3307 domain-containing protein [Allorhizocola rhizosphaerae]